MAYHVPFDGKRWPIMKYDWAVWYANTLKPRQALAAISRELQAGRGISTYWPKSKKRTLASAKF